MTVAGPVRSEVTLSDRYTVQSGSVLLSGIQALVRLMLDQRHLDERRGYDTGVFVSGYQGSPLGGLDQELARSRALLEPAGIVFHPGLNEELAATAVAGTQLLGELPGARKQGVTGFWYGKNPGLERAADAIRHGTFSGTAPLGGAVALVGDDPNAKSSTVPSACEQMCRTLGIPVLAPSSVEEIVSLGLHAVAISRHAGVWSALKLTSDLADSSGLVDVESVFAGVPNLPPREWHAPPVLLPPSNLVAEHDLFHARLDRALEYGRLARLNRITFEPHRPRFGVIASGMAYQAVLRALSNVGLSTEAIDAIGLRLARVSMPWPLGERELRELTDGLETVLIVEDKLPFVESQLKEALYRQQPAPVVLGKHDHEGRDLLPAAGSIGADEVAVALGRLLPDELLTDEVRARMRSARDEHRIDLDLGDSVTKRSAYFCSGCPHNSSTRAHPDQLVGVGIGCHTMVVLDRRDRRGHLIGSPQMGGEGAQWFGLAPFVDEPHFIQNMGDGTFHHSGSLAIRAAVAAGVNITFRLLYNDAVAMTGGQRPEGKMAVPDLITVLAREGVKRIILTTPEPERYDGVQLDPIAEVRHRDEIERTQAELAGVTGVTVMLHDDRCATEKRRLRKRGMLETPAQRVWINERVCEGCGDCGEQSSCLSVQPVQTEFGRKTRIHQSSCNLDMSCLKGDCPSFVLVKPKSGRARTTQPQQRAARPAPPSVFPEPRLIVPEDVLIRMPGVGGTGVVTVAAILRMAAFIDGRHAGGVDQTGLAQKGGPVLSDLRISRSPIEGQVRASKRSVDVLLGFDLLGCIDAGTLATLDTQRTVAVLNSDLTPTAATVTDPTASLPASARLIGHIRQATRAADAIALTAETLSEGLFGDHMQANMLLLGAAFQHGCLPLSAESIERAIELNGAAVDANIAAFRWGRVVISDPAALDEELGRGGAVAPPPAPVSAAAQRLLASRPVPEVLRELLGRSVSELIDYQNVACAQRYLDDVLAVAAIERDRLGGGDGTSDATGAPEGALAVTRAYAAGLFKLTAYKDEYEVARLHLDPAEQARLHAEFGDDVSVQVLLHPPLLRGLGVDRKLAFGAGARPLFTLLRAGRRLRGTALDPFGHTEIRRLERELVDEYRSLVHGVLDRLDASSLATVVELAKLPDMVRGYEQIKLASVQRMRERAGELTARLQAPQQAVELDLVMSH